MVVNFIPEDWLATPERKQANPNLVLATCAFCGREFLIPKGAEVTDSTCCNADLCRLQRAKMFKHRSTKKRRRSNPYR